MRLADSFGFGMCSLPIMALLAFSQVGMTTAIDDETAPIGQQPLEMLRQRCIPVQVWNGVLPST